MKSIVSKIAFPAVVASIAALHVVATDPGVTMDTRLTGIPIEVMTERPDTVIYPVNGYKKGWTEADFKMDASTLADSLLDDSSPADTLSAPADTLPKLTARDTIKAPDSLRLSDPFRYKYYVALHDRPTYLTVRDSLLASQDSLAKAAPQFTRCEVKR